ncbi:MAG: dihydrofolate reductase [Candidatus Saccharibacteria bacterium]
MVVAYDNERGIGAAGGMLWKLSDIPRDMENFRKLTLGKTIIMGRRTLESIGQALPHRRNIVISSEPGATPNIEYVTSIDQAFVLADSDEDVYIIGGGQVYIETLDRTDRIHATEVNASFNADVFFPVLDDHWHESSRESHPADERNKYNLDFVVYDRTTR